MQWVNFTFSSQQHNAMGKHRKHKIELAKIKDETQKEAQYTWYNETS